jgi:DNA-binding transcriptional LysR family regulator
MNVLRLTLRQLQIFVAVARCGTTMAAGAEIALSQSATSSAVNELERLLSLRLFDRAGKRLLLNDNGRALLPRALALLDGAASIEQMAGDGSAQRQSLRIGASTTIGNHILPRLLPRFVAGQSVTAPAWQSRVAIGNTAAICDSVAAFDLDVGLIEGPSHRAVLTMTPWLQDELAIVGAPGHAHPAAHRGPGRWSVRDLRECVWLLREPGSGTREATDQVLMPHLHGYRRSIELGSSEAIMQAAAAGLGVACLSAWAIDDHVRAGRLQRLDTTLPRLLRQCHVIVHREKQPTPALLEFLRVVKEPSLVHETGIRRLRG